MLKTAAQIMCLALSLFLTALLQPPISQAETFSQEKPQHIIALIGYDQSSFHDVLEGIKTFLVSKKINARYTTILLDNDQSPEASIQKAIGSNPDVIVCLGTNSLASKGVLQSGLPVIYTMVASPEKIVTPATTAHGVSLHFPIETELKFLQKLLPQVHKIGVIYQSAENQEKVAKASLIARSMGLEIIAAPVNSPKDIPFALEKVMKETDVLWGIHDNMVLSPKTAKKILLESFRNKIPLIGLSKLWVKAGALYALERDYKDIGSQCGEIVLQVLNKKKPGTIQDVPPRKILYTLNMKTAKHMKLTVPDSLVENAAMIY